MERLSHGLRGYASILGALVNGGATTGQIAAIMTFGGCVKSNRLAINRLLRRLVAMEVVHVSAWAREIGCLPCEVWALGPGLNAPLPPLIEGGGERTRLKPKRLPMRSDTLLFGQIVLALRDGHSAIDLAELVGANVSTLYKLFKHMHALGLIRIVEWHRQPSSNPRPVYALGSGSNKPRPPPITRAETDLRHKGARKQREQSLRICRMICAPLAPHSDFR